MLFLIHVILVNQSWLCKVIKVNRNELPEILFSPNSNTTRLDITCFINKSIFISKYIASYIFCFHCLQCIFTLIQRNLNCNSVSQFDFTKVFVYTCIYFPVEKSSSTFTALQWPKGSPKHRHSKTLNSFKDLKQLSITSLQKEF